MAAIRRSHFCYHFVLCTVCVLCWRIVLGYARVIRLMFLGTENVLLVGQASCFCSRDACCLRDGAHAPRLAVLVRKDCSFFVDHHDDYGVGLCLTEIGACQLELSPAPRSMLYGDGRIDEPSIFVSVEVHRTLYAIPAARLCCNSDSSRYPPHFSFAL